MMRCKVVLAWALTLFAISPSTGLTEESAAHVFCRMNWASQPDRLSECVKAQNAGATSIIRWLDWAKQSGDPAALHIISTYEHCNARWSPDFQLIEACLRAGSPLAPPGG